MDDYYEMEAEQRNNSRRLKQMGRKKAGKDMPFPNERRSTFRQDDHRSADLISNHVLKTDAVAG